MYVTSSFDDRLQSAMFTETDMNEVIQPSRDLHAATAHECD